MTTTMTTPHNEPSRPTRPGVRTTRWHLALALLLALLGSMLLPASATALITQSFTTTEPLVVGSIVSLSGSAPNSVKAASPSNVTNLYGVVTEVGTGNAQVATSELVTALVSNGNGDIAIGSPITASAMKGVGQKATVSTRIVGFAQAPFSAKQPGAQKATVKDKGGHSRELVFGSIPVMLGAGNYVAAGGAHADNSDGTWIPTAIQHFFASIAGHQVVPSRIILSLFVLLVVVVVVGMLVGTSVHSSLISIGRNPLASRNLLKALIQVASVAVLMMAGAMGAIYFIVTK